VSSVRKREGERKYLRKLRLMAMNDVINYVDSETFGNHFMKEINEF
jgi:hypothetical protein